MRCGKSDEQVRLFDGFYGFESIKICEKCSIISNIPIIKRPSADQLKSSERPFGVRDRLNVMAGLKKEEKIEKSLKEEMNELENSPQLQKPEELVFKLVDNFHWILQMGRRRRGFTVKQLADSIGEGESAIKMLEKGIVPAKAFNLIEKIEQFLKIKLIKKDAYENIIKESQVESVRLKPLLGERKPIVLEEAKKITVSVEKRVFDRKEQIKREESNDMIKQAIYEEKSPSAKRKEMVDGSALKIEDFRHDKIRELTMADVRNMDDKNERDFEVEGLKRRDELGREQVEDFGKEDIEKLKRKTYRQETMGASAIVNSKIAKGKTPTIYDLMKAREEKEKKFGVSDASIKPERVVPRISSAEQQLPKQEEASGKKKKGFFSSLKYKLGLGKVYDRLDIDLETGLPKTEL